MARPRAQPRPAERQIYFYRATSGDDDPWRRRDVLEAINAIPIAERYIDAGDGDSVLLPIIDHVPTTTGDLGQMRFFRVRRSNLPAVEQAGELTDLPIAEEAGLAEPTHILFAPRRVVVGEYNHFGPRMSALSFYFRRRLGLRVQFETFVQGDALEQLERLEDVRLVELTARPSEETRQALAGDDIWGAIEQAAQIEETRAVSIRLTAGADSPRFTRRVKQSVRRIIRAHAEEDASVFKVRGLDPETGSPEVIDLLAPKVVRRVNVSRAGSRSRALNTRSAYRALREALETAEDDLRRAGTLG